MADLNKFRSFVISKNPNISKEQLAQLDDFVQKQQAAELVKSGALTLDQIPQDQRITVASYLSPEEVKKSPTAADKKNQDSLNAINNLIGNLEKRYQEGGGAPTTLGPLNRILGGITGLGGELGLNDSAKLYSNERQGFAATLKSLTGDTGVMTEQDFARLSKLIPGLGATQGEATGAFNDLRSQVGAKFGGQAQPTTFIPNTPKKTGNPLTDTLTSNPIINFLLDKAINIGQDVGTGIRAGQEQPQLQGLDTLAKSIEDEAYATKDPQQKKDLLANANMVRSQISEEAGNLSQSFSKDVTQNPLIRGLLGATQIASTAEIPGLVKGGIKVVANAPKTIKGAGNKIFTQGTGKAMRNEVVGTAEQAGKVVDGSKISEPLKSWADTAKNAHPNKSATIDRMVESVDKQLGGKSVKPGKLFDLWDEANNGFKATSGDAGRTLEASYHRAVRDVVRKELDKVAPGFEEGTKLIRQGMQRTDIAKSIGSKAGNVAIGALLYKLLFGGGGGGQ